MTTFVTTRVSPINLSHRLGFLKIQCGQNQATKNTSSSPQSTLSGMGFPSVHFRHFKTEYYACWCEQRVKNVEEFPCLPATIIQEFSCSFPRVLFWVGDDPPHGGRFGSTSPPPPSPSTRPRGPASQHQQWVACQMYLNPAKKISLFQKKRKIKNWCWPAGIVPPPP